MKLSKYSVFVNSTWGYQCWWHAPRFGLGRVFTQTHHQLLRFAGYVYDPVTAVPYEAPAYA